ncbi:hypothetical protein BGX24_004883 [Mortierella sp. AD032]|nr:hypothetical protein BGX24_004883 [Mortierella sp. AD032]
MVDEQMDSLYWFSDCEDSFIAHQPNTFLSAAVFLTQDTYMYGSESMKRHIIRFLAKYVNAYPVMDDLSISLIATICNEWKPHAHEAFLAVSKSLLSKTSHHWVPRHGMTQASNPVWILLDKARSHPKAIGLLEVFIDYCIRQAKRHKDPQYLVPIEQCLHELVDPSLFFSDAILRMLRQMAYLPARGHALLVDHHTIAHPPRFRWRFWRTAPRGLRQHKDQVMQVSYEKEVDSEQESFSRSLYQVNFALLWRVINPKAPPSSLPPPPPTVSPEVDASTATVVTTKASGAAEKTDPTLSGRGQKSQTLFSWTLAVLYMLRRKARLSRGNRVECHSFDLQALDNPALIALVEYKWNTIAFNYWLVRFLGQLLYYILVLTAVFLQIYGDNRVVEKNVIINDKPEVIKELFSDPGPGGLYISIIVIALMFLWLEIVQLMKDIRCYFESVYNWVDLFVFLLPLVGAISQILIIYGISNAGFNTGSLSFSVLLIFLHFLFELRVFQIVCHFVSIIIRAIYSIRVFIFVISGGLLAFAIAVLHLLHDCVDAEQCSYFTDKYSNNLLRSISVTYFMMGGNYDPVEGGFSSNSPAFHFMMMVFFFFTVILMMNVLIALINNAIGDGDQTWQLDWMLNRMRYIENAENMTYDIPGFRENHDYFPHTIFYSGSSQQVREYEKKTRQMEDEAAPVTLNADGQVQQLPESSDTATATATTAAAAVTAAAVVVAATATATAEKINDDSASTKTKEKENDLADEGVARLVETELRKQLDVERESSGRQISTLQQQLREQQQILVQILAKLEQ